MTIQKMATQKAVSAGGIVPKSGAIGIASSSVTPVVTVASGDVVRTLSGLQAALTAMAQGWSTVFPADLSLPTTDGGFSQAAVVSQINTWLALYPAVAAAKLGSATAVAQLRQTTPAMRAQLSSLKAALKAYFGPGNPQLTQFGIKPAKARAALSGETLMVRAARAKQTRVIRGTLGAKQKAALKFQGVLVAQVTAPGASPAASAETAPATQDAAPAGSAVEVAAAPAAGK
jgi:hypothetical protein